MADGDAGCCSVTAAETCTLRLVTIPVTANGMPDGTYPGTAVDPWDC